MYPTLMRTFRSNMSAANQHYLQILSLGKQENFNNIRDNKYIKEFRWRKIETHMKNLHGFAITPFYCSGISCLITHKIF